MRVYRARASGSTSLAPRKLSGWILRTSLLRSSRVYVCVSTRLMPSMAVISARNSFSGELGALPGAEVVGVEADDHLEVLAPAAHDALDGGDALDRLDGGELGVEYLLRGGEGCLVGVLAPLAAPLAGDVGESDVLGDGAHGRPRSKNGNAREIRRAVDDAAGINGREETRSVSATRRGERIGVGAARRDSPNATTRRAARSDISE